MPKPGPDAGLLDPGPRSPVIRLLDPSPRSLIGLSVYLVDLVCAERGPSNGEDLPPRPLAILSRGQLWLKAPAYDRL